jgi:integrase
VRIAAVLDAAKVVGYRTGDNPAGAEIVSKLLPPRKDTARTHFAAVPYSEVPAFMTALRAREGVAARALEILIHTATRTTETLQARWDEIDLGAKLWVIPKSRMKAAVEHRVPLTPQVIQMLADLPREEGHPYLFISSRPGRPLTAESMLRTMRRMGRTESVHGLRSSFSDWAHEQSSAAPFVIEAALAHAVGNSVARDYRRGDLLDRRRKLMEAWSKYLATSPAVADETGAIVTPIGSVR